MDRLQCGNLAIISDDDKLVFELKTGGLRRAAIGGEDIPRLLDFLKHHQQALNTSRRSGFRLQLDELSRRDAARFSVAVEVDGEAMPLRPIDFSVSGLLVETYLELGGAGAEVKLQLSFDDQTVWVPAVVIRRQAQQGRCAFQFTPVWYQDAQCPSRELHSIFYRLESLWLDSCLQLQWARSA
ncbi:PilZ domain-containing protein [Kineobactrum salinum]|uniref:PilZ domain-containing protein n=1 Tax=Kineobactrum salinum TaxID=2708301 RepID=A0A6C0TYY1_9GAMM|nr:PilZ domain-containing protein [Kineobactrum salinum]QIB65030.1 PilZ domain-containing protein [Kineobactrum salinum]